jgi:hypothetical protein
MALKPSLREVLTGLRKQEVPGLEPEARAMTAMEAHWRESAATPWYVRALIGFGGWVASCFLLLFFGLAIKLHDETAMLVLGLVLCAATMGLRHLSNKVFLTQLFLAFNLTGQALFLIGVGGLSHGETAIALGALCLNLALLLLYPDTVLRFLAAMAALLSLLVLAYQTHRLELVDLTLVGLTVLLHLLWLQQARLQRGRFRALVSPVGFALVLTLFGSLLARSFTGSIHEFRERAMHSPLAILTLGLAVVTLYTASRVLQETGLEPGGAAGVTVFVGLGLTALLTLSTPGVIAAAGILALAFHRRSVVLLGLAVAFLLTFGVLYYYDLSLSLLAKSLALTGSGLVMLGLRLFILRRFPAPAQEAR